eukprot:Gb_22406 [translate_table: standard]
MLVLNFLNRFLLIIRSTAENHHRPYAIIDSSRVVVKYGFWDFIREFLNPKNGAQPPFVVSQETEECNEVIHGDLQAETKEQDYSPGKVILIAHSAGGWSSRILVCITTPFLEHILNWVIMFLCYYAK